MTATAPHGAQPERTGLAWRRTTLAFAVVVVLAVREGARTGRGWAAVAVGAALWVGFLVLAHRRLLVLAGRRPPAPSAATVAGAACAMLGTAVCAVVLVTGG
ncbi:DUF202 domain-containing protein [Streptomyces avicenniae]|uniref:DUF202 domain-containing protein n=1 Tax=Streptomyces avicenniae TaxID=500153 RepID=UPI00069AF40F|nr:DUF202 domain-containing protein [Streptomyces avicenniae]